MKKFIYIILFLSGFELILGQQASDYFPEQPEVRWEYKVTPLDSSNNEIDTLSYYRHDKFFVEADFDGKLAKILQTKSGPKQTIHFQPYLDSLFFHFEGANGYEHFKVGYVGFLFGILDSILNNPNFSFVELLNSLEQWYSVYRFAQTINDEYTILQIDTTVTISSENIPLRFEYLGVRLPDELLETPIGDFESKKFIRKIGVSYLIIPPPPLPVIPIPIAFLNDTVWIAPDYWIVKGMIPSINIDLTVINLNVPPFFIPGFVTKLDTVVITSVKLDEEHFNPNQIRLSQNYPNPFNPGTKISWQLPVSSRQNLKIYDVLGNEVATLVDEYKPAGSYEIEWNASGLPSGVYFYRLQAGEFIETKKMILMK